jgi:phosphoribosyl 1,2-cyclic phosphodiesterase
VVRFDGFTVIPFRLKHDVPNQGYKIHFDSGEKIFFATDTGSLDGIEAPNYDLYLVEANHTEADIRRRIWEKEVEGVYCYEYKARRNHLSQEACDAWLYTQMGSRSRYVYMHQHKDKEKKTKDG